MEKSTKCPYCSGSGEKIKARVAGQPTHLTFGYVENTFRCRECGETWSICNPVPPKGHPKSMDIPNPGILNVTFSQGTSGFANCKVLTAKSGIVLPEPEKPKAESMENEPTAVMPE